MHCDQARTEIIAYLKGELSSDKRQRLEEHLARCPDCRHELEGARRLLSWTEAASKQAVVKQVEDIIDSAVKSGASDIHIEPQRDNALLVRFRIDGVLTEVAKIEPAQHSGVVARLKMMAEMDLSENRLPQDGRLTWKCGDEDFDIRMNCTPFVYGESIVMRPLIQSHVMLGLDQLMFCDDHLHAVRNLLRQPSGLILTSGPTGSGKTTLLYSMLLETISPAVKVMTIEDPVEYILPGAEQAQVNVKAGFTFTNALRTFFRRDPDVIMVGEIRNLETALLVTEAALTGHLVLSQLHTNDALGVIERLRDMEVQDFIIAACLIGASNQRLVRRVCPSCKTRLAPDSREPAAMALGITPEEIADSEVYIGTGCEACRNTGYLGRAAIYEILTVDRDLSAMIGEHASSRELLEAARAKGFITLAEDAKRKVLSGLTTPREALRVLPGSTA